MDSDLLQLDIIKSYFGNLKLVYWVTTVDINYILNQFILFKFGSKRKVLNLVIMGLYQRKDEIARTLDKSKLRTFKEW